MQPLESPHSHFVSAAEGWLELGNVVEARAELAQIDATLQNHPAVLAIRWGILAEEKNWIAALAIARELVVLVPDSPMGWLHQAYAIRRIPEGGLQVAWDCLFSALEKFPKVAVIPYNLACYACQLDQMAKARALLRQAMKIDGKNHIKEMALNDADLKPLWDEIRGL